MNNRRKSIEEMDEEYRKRAANLKLDGGKDRRRDTVKDPAREKSAKKVNRGSAEPTTNTGVPPLSVALQNFLVMRAQADDAAGNHLLEVADRFRRAARLANRLIPDVVHHRAVPPYLPGATVSPGQPEALRDGYQQFWKQFTAAIEPIGHEVTDAFLRSTTYGPWAILFSDEWGYLEGLITKTADGGIDVAELGRRLPFGLDSGDRLARFAAGLEHIAGQAEDVASRLYKPGKGKESLLSQLSQVAKANGVETTPLAQQIVAMTGGDEADVMDWVNRINVALAKERKRESQDQS